MISKKEIITVSRDDPLFPKCEEVLTEENGWKKDECTVSVSYTRRSWSGQVLKAVPEGGTANDTDS